jgi:putative ATP-binding cassette transporter
MRIVTFFFQHSRKLFLLSVSAGIVSGACNAALLAVLNVGLKRNGSSPLLVWGFIGLCSLLPLTRFTSECLLTKLGQGAMYELRMQLCRQCLAAPLRHLEELGNARLLAALTDDIPTITNAVTTIPLVCVNAALVVGCLIYLGILSWILFLVVFGFMVFGIMTYQLLIVKVGPIFGRARKDTDVLQDHFRGLTYGCKELKVHRERRHAFIRQSLDKTASSLRRDNTAALNLYSAASSWGQVLFFVVLGLTIFLLPLLRPIALSTLTGYALTLLYLMTPLQVIMNTLPPLSRANVALRSVRELGFTLASEGTEELPERVVAQDQWTELEFRSVTHTYHREGEANGFVLGPINLVFRPGEVIFIIGGNGSGKTTLVKLLTGLYSPEAGQIHLSGLPIKDNGREAYRQHFSVVFSDFYLFETVLGLADEHIDDRAAEYLDKLKLSYKVQVVDGKLSTTQLSQGQRKRLALLTALLEDRPIYIFDEWAADQDPYFRNVFYTQLLPDLKARGKTVFVISHDDRYFYLADRIIKLEEGQIVMDSLKEAGILWPVIPEVRYGTI